VAHSYVVAHRDVVARSYSGGSYVMANIDGGSEKCGGS
jgi:hypothetical protein